MSGWTSGYVVDVGYTHGFYKELTPSFLSFAALVQGYAIPGLGNEPLTFCELGCGQGVSTNLLAAANPHIQFYANDFNPAHVAGARDLAGAAGLANVQFFDDSFAEFGDNRQLPVFDVITLHGIYSWISPENRSHIVRFIRERLKPGGAVYLSYNAMPGWAPMMPLRHLMNEYAARQGAGSILKKVGGALEFVDRLTEAKAKYFAINPKAATHAQTLKKQNPSYVAHEYFNKDFTPFYFSEIAQELAEAKLTFIGSAHVLDSIDPINLTQDQQKVLAEIDDVGLRQTVRDHMIDQQFRRDIFVKGPVPLSNAASKERWLGTRFVLTSAGSDISRTIRAPLGEVKLQAELYDPLIAALENGPRSVRDLLARPELAKLGLAEIRQALVLLVGQGSCHPCLPEAGEPGRRAHCAGFNAAMVERSRSGADVPYFASGVTGGGLKADRVNQLICLAKRNHAKDVPDFIYQTLQQSGQRLMKENKPLDSRDETVAGIAESVVQFDRNFAPVLTNLGIP
jgi:SAM-dependent methyltransferase